MARVKGRTISRKATMAQTSAMAETVSCLETDAAATAALGENIGTGSVIYATLPDEEIEFSTKVDFSVLKKELMEVAILDDDSVRLLPKEQLYEYAAGLAKTLRFYVGQYQAVAEQLGNAMELILNQRIELFGSTSQRTSSLFGGKGERDPEKAYSVGDSSSGQAAVGTPEVPQSPGNLNPSEQDPIPVSPDPEQPEHKEQGEEIPEAGKGNGVAIPGNDTPSGSTKGQPKRTAGCAAKVYEDAVVRHFHCTIPESRLDQLFGGSGWKELTEGERIATEYAIIPATVVVKVFHLHAYCAKDCSDPAVPGVVRARSPIIRSRQKSPVSGGLMASVLYSRNALRIPVSRICDDLNAMGLKMTPQRLYENLHYYDRFFQYLLDQMWIVLLSAHYIQIDETPVRYYDKETHRSRRGYLWVFTTSEMLVGGMPVTLFYFAEGRGADVLSRCLRGFEGVAGSDGHSAYHVFARESGGTVTNAGCLDHFRKRVVAALRAIPNLREMTEQEKLGIPAYVIMLKLNRVFDLERRTKKLATKEERDAYRQGPVRDAFDELVETTLGISLHDCPVGSYTSKAIKYMQNQEVYLREFLEDSNIASNNSKCERKFAFFATLRNQIKMFGSARGAEVAATLESIEQTAREYTGNTRIYYKYLIEKMCPFIRDKQKEDPDVDFQALEEFQQFHVWSDEFKAYKETVQQKEEIVTSIIEYF